MILSAQQLDRLATVLWNWAAIFVPRLLAAIGILIAGLVVSVWIARAMRNTLLRASHVNPALKPVMVSVARYAVVAVTIIATLDQLGFQTSSLLAMLGAAGIAVGLALQGTLSNIAAGIMLLWLKPFQIGDYIEVGGQGGAVEEIGLFGCKLRTFDGVFLFLPNSSIWNTPLKNHTRNLGRLVSIDVTLPPAAEIAHARDVLVQTSSRIDGVLSEPSPRAFVESLSGSGLVLSLVIWSRPQEAGTVERSVIEAIKRTLESAGNDALKPIQIARTIPADADPSRFLQSREPISL
jgi:small conductance mechanosensitive channel